MKIKLAFLFLLLAVVLAGCGAQGFVALPDDVQTGIGVVAAALVGVVLAYLIALVPFFAFLDQFKLPLSAAIASQIISIIQDAVPDQFGSVAVHVLRALLALFALVYAGVALQRQGLLKN